MHRRSYSTPDGRIEFAEQQYHAFQPWEVPSHHTQWADPEVQDTLQLPADNHFGLSTGPAPKALAEPPSRSPNAWILFRCSRLKERKLKTSMTENLTQGELSKMLAQEWRTATPEIKRFFEREAEIKKSEHATLYPNLKGRNEKRVIKKKKSRIHSALSIDGSMDQLNRRASWYSSASSQPETPEGGDHCPLPNDGDQFGLSYPTYLPVGGPATWQTVFSANSPYPSPPIVVTGQDYGFAPYEYFPSKLAQLPSPSIIEPRQSYQDEVWNGYQTMYAPPHPRQNFQPGLQFAPSYLAPPEFDEHPQEQALYTNSRYGPV